MHIAKTLLVTALFSANVYAQDVEIVGTIDHLATPAKKSTLSGKVEKKHLQILKVKISPKGMQVLRNRAQNIHSNQSHTLSSQSKLPKKVTLGMNNVPVLNQGQFGSCVTFANTAAVDAALNKGDYISQVCLLQLGTYLAKNGYGVSGWQGSFGRLVLNQMENYGIVNKSNQTTVGCGGMTQYPIGEEIANFDPNSMMSLEEFHQISEDLGKTPVTWSPILDAYQSILERTDTNKTLEQVKAALNEKDRVTFGVFLFDLDLGFMGAVGTHKTPYDTWTLTPVILRDLHLTQAMGAHEMIITGYDDEAITTDEEGNKYKGLLTLRNSWSEKYGDKGDFYMTYDFFKALVMEAQRIRTLPDTVVDDLNPNIG